MAAPVVATLTKWNQEQMIAMVSLEGDPNDYQINVPTDMLDAVAANNFILKMAQTYADENEKAALKKSANPDLSALVGQVLMPQ